MSLTLSGAHEGRRRITPRMIVAEAAVEAAPRPTGEVSAQRCLRAFKRAAVAYGWPRRLVDFVDHLASYTQGPDWRGPWNPVAWPSNDALQTALGVGRTALKARIRAAVELGLVAMRDGPGGRRFGVRDTTGQIVAAYGFDLSPLVRRLAEFEAIAAAAAERRAEGKRLRREICVTRDRILGDAACGREARPEDPAWAELERRAQALFARRGASRDPAELWPVVSELRALAIEVRELVTNSILSPVNSDPYGSEYRPPIQENYKAPGIPEGIAAAPADRAVENSSRDRGAESEAGTEAEAAATAAAAEGPVWGRYPLTLPVLVSLAPALAVWLRRDQAPVWPEVVEAASYLAAEIGISPAAWKAACLALGRPGAAVAVAVVAAKHASGRVTNPGGYLRSMLAAYRTGTLRLDRTLFGLWKPNARDAPT